MISSYWDLRDAAQSAPALDADVLRERLKQVVRGQMVADVPLGVFLSGGIDSGAVVTAAAQASPGVLGLTAAIDDPAWDETSDARALAAKYEVRHIVEPVPEASFAHLDVLSRVYDSPFGDVSALPTLVLCRAAAKHAKVWLSGDGGDEAFAGYRRYRFHATAQQVGSRLPASLRRILFGAAGALYPKLDWAPQPLRAKTTFEELALPEPEAYARVAAALPPGLLRSLVRPGSPAAGHDPYVSIRKAYTESDASIPLQRAQYADIRCYLPGDILTKVDRAAMAHSIEVRCPLLDHDLVAAAYALPQSAKLKSSAGKALLREAVAPLLPESHLRKPKRGFAVPIGRWLRTTYRQHAQALPRSAVLGEYVNGGQTAKLVAAHMSGTRDYGRALWLLLVLEGFLARERGAEIARVRPPERAATLTT